MKKYIGEIFPYASSVTREGRGTLSYKGNFSVSMKNGHGDLELNSFEGFGLFPDNGKNLRMIVQSPDFRKNPRYLEAPHYRKVGWPSIFLAGTITGAKKWQEIAAEELIFGTEATILNPRRQEFNMEDDLDEEQIGWEHEYLHEADLVLFWFAKETVGPITLFELGSHLNKNIIVGCDPEYPRKTDLEIQLKLARPDLEIKYSLEDLLTLAQEKISEMCEKELDY